MPNNQRNQQNGNGNQQEHRTSPFKNGEGYWKIILMLAIVVVGVATISTGVAVGGTILSCAMSPVPTSPMAISVTNSSVGQLNLPLVTCRSPVIMMGMGVIIVLLLLLVLIYIILTQVVLYNHRQANKDW